MSIPARPSGGTGPVPKILVVREFPIIVLLDAPTLKPMHGEPDPEMKVFANSLDSPPIVLLLPNNPMPEDLLGIALVPVTSVPMKFPIIVFEFPASSIPKNAFPESRLFFMVLLLESVPIPFSPLGRALVPVTSVPT